MLLLDAFPFALPFAVEAFYLDMLLLDASSFAVPFPFALALDFVPITGASSPIATRFARALADTP